MERNFDPANKEYADLIDPVCGMRVNKPEVAPTYTYEGHTYYFCSDTCRNQFAGRPSRYAPVNK